MCWSGEASAALAVTGFASTAYFYYKGEYKSNLWSAGLFFFDGVVTDLHVYGN